MRSSRIICSLTTEHALVQEYILLQNECITQLYIIQSEENPFLWFGVLFVDSGIYKGAVIRFNMIVEESYPDCTCPKIVFNPIPYHPLVNPVSGELDTKNAFPNWNSNENKLHELLLFVKRVIRQADEYMNQFQELFNIPLGKAGEQNLSEQKNNDDQRSQEPDIQRQHLDEDSIRDLFIWFDHTFNLMKTYVNSPGEFYKRIEDFKHQCCQQLFERPSLCGDDNNALIFTPWNPEIHEPIRNTVLAGRFAPANLFASYHKDSENVTFIPGHEQ